MSAQNVEQYSYEAVRKQIDGNVNIGGPPIQQYQSINILQATGCTGGDQELFNQVQRAAECACGSEGPGGGPLCAALAAGQVVTQQPFSCMIDLINNYADCDQDISQSKRVAAYQAFSDVTGYRPANLNTIFDTINGDFEGLVNFNAFYMFAPTLILALIIIWLMVGFRWIDWPVGLFFTVLVIVILYGFSILYRIHFQNWIKSRNTTVQNQATIAQKSFENSIAYWPQGLFAAACAVTCDGTTGCWTCNENNNCPPCVKSTRSTRANRVCGAVVYDDEYDEIIEEPPRRPRNGRIQRRGRRNV